MNLLIIVDHHHSRGPDLAKLFGTSYKKYFDEKLKNISSLIEYAFESEDFKVFNALYNTTRWQLHPSVKKMMNDGGFSIDFNLHKNHLTYSDLQSFEKIYYCGGALCQCIMYRPHGYLRLNHKNKILVKDAIFTRKGIKPPVLRSKLSEHDAFEFEDIESLQDWEKKFWEINNLNHITVDELIRRK